MPGLRRAHGRDPFALEEFMPPKGTVKIEVERCKACGFCVEFCPSHVLALSSAFNSKGYHPPHVIAPEKCSGCDLCGMYCPDFAITGAKIKAQAGHTGDTAK
jgi:2-oxoglutarate ferredoxin oxidoreductase subunit delta